MSTRIVRKSPNNKKIKADDDLASAVACGRRIKHLRNYLGFSRKMFCRRHGISAASLQNWEDVRFHSLTDKAALKLVNAFQAEGISCTLDWLLRGDGFDPIANTPPVKAILPAQGLTQEASIIAEELRVFYALNKNATDTIVKDDEMEPKFSEGDLVAGHRYFNADILQFVDCDCIVQMQEGDVLVRRLQAGHTAGRYNLVALNAKHQATMHVNIPLFSVAPIVWIRKKHPMGK